jgi:polar amino acid transport system ATP-binding protein
LKVASFGKKFPTGGKKTKTGSSVSSSTPVIDIRGLHKAYGSLEVIKGVDIIAHKGDVVSLIGSSGSGKSTILRCANLLEDSQSGEILFKGEPVKWKGAGHSRHPADAKQVLRIRTNFSMVFQQFNLWAHMTILQNVMEAPVTVLGRDKAGGNQSPRLFGQGRDRGQMRCLSGPVVRRPTATRRYRPRPVHGTRSHPVR